MCWFWKHTWKTVGTDYVEPLDEIEHIRGPGAFEEAKKLLSGYTIVHQKCTKCGSRVYYEVLGKYHKDEGESNNADNSNG